jgi:hypothetical protein
MMREDMIKLNEILDRLTLNGFFENSKEIRDFYEYLADKYRFDLKTHTIDPVSAEIIPISNNDKIYFDKMTK